MWKIFENLVNAFKYVDTPITLVCFIAIVILAFLYNINKNKRYAFACIGVVVIFVLALVSMFVGQSSTHPRSPNSPPNTNYPVARPVFSYESIRDDIVNLAAWEQKRRETPLRTKKDRKDAFYDLVAIASDYLSLPKKSRVDFDRVRFSAKIESRWEILEECEKLSEFRKKLLDLMEKAIQHRDCPSADKYFFEAAIPKVENYQKCINVLLMMKNNQKDFLDGALDTETRNKWHAIIYGIDPQFSDLDVLRFDSTQIK